MYGLISMFQACVSISACIFYVFMNILRVCVYKWAYCWVKKKRKEKFTDLPTLFFSSPLRQYNLFFFLALHLGSPLSPNYCVKSSLYITHYMFCIKFCQLIRPIYIHWNYVKWRKINVTGSKISRIIVVNRKCFK